MGRAFENEEKANIVKKVWMLPTGQPFRTNLYQKFPSRMPIMHVTE
jgi:hypothetical protein